MFLRLWLPILHEYLFWNLLFLAMKIVFFEKWSNEQKKILSSHNPKKKINVKWFIRIMFLYYFSAGKLILCDMILARMQNLVIITFTRAIYKRDELLFMRIGSKINIWRPFLHKILFLRKWFQRPQNPKKLESHIFYQNHCKIYIFLSIWSTGGLFYRKIIAYPQRDNQRKWLNGR